MSKQEAISALTKLAAACHRAKWQFDLNDDYQPTKRVARDLILNAFRELHQIGDLALKLRDELPPPALTETPASYRRIYDEMQRGKVSADERTKI